MSWHSSYPGDPGNVRSRAMAVVTARLDPDEKVFNQVFPDRVEWEADQFLAVNLALDLADLAATAVALLAAATKKTRAAAMADLAAHIRASDELREDPTDLEGD